MKRMLALLFVFGAISCGEEEAPYFESILHPAPVQHDPIGPYLIEANVHASRGVKWLNMMVSESLDDRLFAEMRFELVAGNKERGRWSAQLPGRPFGSSYYYYLVLVDQENKAAHTPERAPKALFGFEIIAP